MILVKKKFLKKISKGAVSRDGTSTTSLDNLFQCFTTLMLKKFFLISIFKIFQFKVNIPCYRHNLKVCPCLKVPSRYWKAIKRSPGSPLFSKLNHSNSPSQSSQERCSISLLNLWFETATVHRVHMMNQKLLL